jgi:hypothetical protein
MVHREPEMRAKTDRSKTQIQGITDIEELRSMALKHRDHLLEDWRDFGYMYRQMRDGMLWASLITTTFAVVLAYSLHGLRGRNRAG